MVGVVQGNVRKLIEPELSQEAQKRLGIHRGAPAGCPCSVPLIRRGSHGFICRANTLLDVLTLFHFSNIHWFDNAGALLSATSACCFVPVRLEAASTVFRRTMLSSKYKHLPFCIVAGHHAQAASTSTR